MTRDDKARIGIHWRNLVQQQQKREASAHRACVERLLGFVNVFFDCVAGGSFFAARPESTMNWNISIFFPSLVCSLYRGVFG